jgi:hypothetical protein
MDEYPIKAAIVIGALLALGLLWLVWKFFFKLFKHVIIALLIGAAGAAFYYYRSLPPPRDPNIGKHAYGNVSGRYLGVVEGQGEDAQRGPIWGVRSPDGHLTKYPKSRVTLKDKLEPPPQTEPAPATTPSPASSSGSPRKKK